MCSYSLIRAIIGPEVQLFWAAKFHEPPRQEGVDKKAPPGAPLTDSQDKDNQGRV